MFLCPLFAQEKKYINIEIRDWKKISKINKKNSSIKAAASY